MGKAVKKEGLHEFRLRQIPKPLWQLTQHLAVSRDLTVNDLILEALRAYVIQHADQTAIHVKELSQSYKAKDSTYPASNT